MQNAFETAGEEVIRIPPFEDSHVHFALAGRPAPAEELKGIIVSCEQHGIFSVKDMGHQSGVGLMAKKEALGTVSVKTAVYALARQGGYGTFLGRGVRDKKEIVAAVRQAAAAGADFIKVINSGIVSAKGDKHLTEGGFTFAELKMILEEAQKRNLEVVCHASSDAAIRDAVRACASSIEHGFFVSDETLHMMAESATAWTPTVYALWILASVGDPSKKAYIEKVVADHLASMHYAASIGVRLCVGTDSGSRGVAHGKSFFQELQLWKKAGLSMEQILSVACMGKEEIDKGNYLVVQKDFLSHGMIDAVYREGTRVNP